MTDWLARLFRFRDNEVTVRNRSVCAENEYTVDTIGSSVSGSVGRSAKVL